MSNKKREKDGERLFTQKELEALISERLMRERKNLEAYKTVKDILDEMMRDGLINACSYAEAARELYERLSAKNAENTDTHAENTEGTGMTGGKKVEEQEEREEDVGVTEADCVTVSEKPNVNGDANVTVDEPVLSEEFPALPTSGQETGTDGDRTSEMCELLKAYPELCIDTLLADEGFILYSQRYGGTLKELYEGYSKLKAALGRIGGEDGKAECRTEIRRMASTSFSRCSASPSSDAGFELSPLQRDIARRAGLSYREYYEMLKDIPDGKKAQRR